MTATKNYFTERDDMGIFRTNNPNVWACWENHNENQSITYYELHVNGARTTVGVDHTRNQTPEEELSRRLELIAENRLNVAPIDVVAEAIETIRNA